MLKIVPQAEPAALATARSHSETECEESGKLLIAADWHHASVCKPEIQSALCSEQSRLCAYCMDRIEPTPQMMKVEHYRPRSKDPGSMFHWWNLLGVCLGKRGAEEFCETARRNMHLPLNPKTDRPIEERFTYTLDGKIWSADPDGQRMIEVLRLNSPSLVRGRRLLLARVRKVASRSSEDLRRLEHETQSTPPPFAGAGRYLIKRLLERSGA